MKKKFVFLTLSIMLIAALLSACGVGDVGDSSYMANKQSQSEEAKQQAESSQGTTAQIEKSEGFSGLCTYFESKNYVIAKTKVTVAANMIGADQGFRYTQKIGESTFDIELYQYDPQNLNDKAQGTINSIKSGGSFRIIDTYIPGIISDNGKYMMVYTDTSSKDENLQKKEEVENVFKSWS